MTESWYQLSSFEYGALFLSLKVAFWSILISLPIGIGCAWVLARKEFPGKNLIDSFLLLPLVLPPVVIGYLLLTGFGQNGVFGKHLNLLGMNLAFNWKGACLASMVMSFPLLVRSIRIAFENLDPRLEETAKTLGASRLDIFFTVSLPLSIPGIISGIILAFARCLGEFGATITFVSNIPGLTQTLPLALYSKMQVPNTDLQALKLCILSVLIAVLALFLSEISANWMRKRMKA